MEKDFDEDDFERMISAHAERVDVDIVGKPVAVQLGFIDETMRKFAQMALLMETSVWDILGEDEVGEDFNVPGVLVVGQAEKQVFDEVLEVITGVLTDDFLPVPAPIAEVAKLNTPVITVLHDLLTHVSDGDVVFVANAMAEDIARVTYAKETEHRGKMQVRCVFHMLPDTLIATKHSVREILVENDWIVALEKVIGSTNKPIHIFFPHNVTRSLSIIGFEDFIKRFVDTSLISSVYGTYFDPIAIKQLEMSGIAPHFDAAVLSDHVDGSALVHVNGVLWKDRSLLLSDLGSLAQQLDLSIYPARYYTKKIRKPPHRLRESAKAIHLSVIRVVKWHVNPTPVKVDLRVEMVNPKFVKLSFKDKKTLYERYKYKINRGRPFTDEDVMFFDPVNVLVNFKIDGYECLMICNGPLELSYLFVRGNPIRCYSFVSMVDAGFVFQCEMVGDYDDPGGAAFYLTDVCVLPTGADPGFKIRYDIGAGVCACSASYITPIVHWVLGTDANFISSLHLDYPTDGYVLTNAFALAGSFKHGLGASRYVKFEDFYTIDACVDRNIYAIPRAVFKDMPAELWDLSAYRLRFDKKSPNNRAEIASVMNAWTVKDMSDFLDVTTIPPYISDSQLAGQGGYRWTREQFVYLICPWRPRMHERLVMAKYGRDAYLAFKKSLRVPDLFALLGQSVSNQFLSSYLDDGFLTSCVNYEASKVISKVGCPEGAEYYEPIDYNA